MRRGLVVAACILGACAKEVPASSDAGAPTATVSASATSSAAADLPVPADFEEEADRAIDAKNYRRELDTIVVELGGKPEDADAGADAGADAATP